MVDISLDTIHWGVDGLGDYYPLATPLPMNYPLEMYVLEGIVYGYADQFLGTLVAGGHPNPILSMVVNEDDTGIIATRSNVTVGATDALWWANRAGEFVSYGSDWDSIDEMEVLLTDTGVYYGYIWSATGTTLGISNVFRVVFEGPGDIQADDNIPFVFRNMRDEGVYWPPEVTYNK